MGGPMADHVDYQSFYRKLDDFVSRGVTASMKLVTDDQHSLWIGLENGAIISLRYGPWTGRTAVRKLEDLPGGNLTIDPKLKLPHMLNLPPTSELMERLRMAVAEGTATQYGSVDPAALDQPVAESASESNGAAFVFRRTEFVAEVRRYLVGILGPIAAVMVDNALNAIGGIDSENQLSAFIEEMRKEADGFIPLEQFDQEIKTLVEGFRST